MGLTIDRGMQKKILLPYFLAGSGHLVSANAIAWYLGEKCPHWDLRFLEPADEFDAKELDNTYRRFWHTLLKRPKLTAVGFWLSNVYLPNITVGTCHRANEKYKGHVRDYLLDYRPDLVITTHWGCGLLFQAARKDYNIDVPLYLVRNDLGGAFWPQDCGADTTFVMSEEARQAFINIGLLESKVIRVNPLVRPEFINGETAIEKVKQKIGIEDRDFTVLMSAGGEGIGRIEATAKIILDVAKERGKEIKVVIITGRNQKLYHDLREEFDEATVKVLGYRDDMHDLMVASDLVVGKCGANYTMETLMSRRPFLISQIGAPNEEYNKDFVVNHGYGWYASRPVELIEIFTKIFTDDGELEEKQRNLGSMPNKSGAEQIADYIIDAVQNPAAKVPSV
ncbi:MAG: hypothetical protein CMN78_03595 [Spirochaetales bacterium]|nr:hypothetical protein [Spirochaetales bacterium]